jgi:hypothetical protein
MYYAKISGKTEQVIPLYHVQGIWFVYVASSGHCLPLTREQIGLPVRL